MKKPIFFLAGSLIIYLLAGCTSVKRFKSATYKSEDNTLVDMTLFGSRLMPGETDRGGGDLWDLSASAQNQLIQILNERYPGNEQFFSSLGREYPVEDEFAFPDLISKDLRMIFTISKERDYKVLNDASGRFSPADRIEYLRFTLEIPAEYNLRFTRWNRFTTEYGDLEIADVSFSRSLDLDVDGTLENLADIKGKANTGRTEEQAVRSRFLKLNGSLSDRRIEIEEEGTREIDLTGNVIADVSLDFSGFPERIAVPRFRVEAGQNGGSAELASLQFKEVLVPRMEEAPDTIRAKLLLEYIYRHVQTGWKTYPEWDDRVEYYSGKVEKEVALFTKQDYLPVLFGIGTDHPDREFIKVMTAAGDICPLQFKDYDGASRFMDWLLSQKEKNIGDESKNDPRRHNPVRLGNSRLLFNERELCLDQMHEIPDLKLIPVY